MPLLDAYVEVTCASDFVARFGIQKLDEGTAWGYYLVVQETGYQWDSETVTVVQEIGGHVGDGLVLPLVEVGQERFVVAQEQFSGLSCPWLP